MLYSVSSGTIGFQGHSLVAPGGHFSWSDVDDASFSESLPLPKSDANSGEALSGLNRERIFPVRPRMRGSRSQHERVNACIPCALGGSAVVTDSLRRCVSRWFY